MYFAKSATALLAMAVSAFAQTADFNPVYTPTENEIIPAGSTFAITWDAPEAYAADTIAISLIGGATQNTQVPLLNIASGVANADETYTWTVPEDLGDAAIYGIVVTLERDTSIFQYSMPFHIEASSSAGSETTSSDDTTVTMTSDFGTATVTLSTASTTEPEPETTTSSAAVNSTTSSIISTTTIVSTTALNTTSTRSTVTPTLSIVTSTEVVDPTNTDESSSEPTDDAGSGAATLGAPVALIAGLAVAFMAL